MVELDNNLLSAKNLLGDTYIEFSNYQRALEIFSNNFKQAEKMSKKQEMANSLYGFSVIYHQKGEYQKALAHSKNIITKLKETKDKSSEYKDFPYKPTVMALTVTLKEHGDLLYK